MKSTALRLGGLSALFDVADLKTAAPRLAASLLRTQQATSDQKWSAILIVRERSSIVEHIRIVHSAAEIIDRRRTVNKQTITILRRFEVLTCGECGHVDEEFKNVATLIVDYTRGS